jgi:hypothetical protein
MYDIDDNRGNIMNNLQETKETWYKKFVSMKENLSKEDSFEIEKKHLLDIHALLHSKQISKQSDDTYYDILWENLDESTCKIISKKETSIAWNIWHITSIEDMTSHILMAKQDEVFDEEIQKELGVTFKDTGNKMTVSEIEIFNNQINLKVLREYRKKVGKSTQKILAKLSLSDLKRKVAQEDIEKIRAKQIATPWLLDFWGRKNMMGLITMPLTKHQIVHINDCFNIKAKYKK